MKKTIKFYNLAFRLTSEEVQEYATVDLPISSQQLLDVLAVFEPDDVANTIFNWTRLSDSNIEALKNIGIKVEKYNENF